MKKIKGLDCWIYKGYINKKESKEIYKKLLEEVPFRNEISVVFNKKFPQRRLTCFMGDKNKAYKYSGRTRKPVEWTDTVKELKDLLELNISLLTEKDHPNFSSCLLNYYRDGNDKIDPHSDSEYGLDKNAYIASLSFGASRDFIIHQKDGNIRVAEIELKNGDLLLMSMKMQRTHKHSVPVRKGVDKGRINLTFRVVKEENIPDDYKEEDVLA